MMSRCRAKVAVRAWLVLVAAITLVACRVAWADGFPPTIDTASPAATLRSFERGTKRIEGLLSDYRMNPSKAGAEAVTGTVQKIGEAVFDLSQVPPALHYKFATASVGFLADILNRLPPIADADIPGGGAPGTELPARWTLPGTDIKMVRLTGGSRSGDYVFSSDTVSRLPDLWRQVISLPAVRPTPLGDWVMAQRGFVGPRLARLLPENLPTDLQSTFWDTPGWKILVIVAMGLTIALLTGAWRFAIGRKIGKMESWRRQALLLTVPMLFGVLTLAGHWFVISEVFPAIEVAEVETTVAMAGLFTAAAWAAWRACNLVSELVIAAHTGTAARTQNAHLVRILARVIGPIAALLIVLYGANVVGVPAVGLLAGVSVGGVAFALAAQYTLENFLGGVTIFADHPFRVGDEIAIDSITGRVESIGPRSTRLRRPDRSVTTIPNSTISKSHLTNLSVRPNMPFKHRMLLSGHIECDRLADLTQAMQQCVESHRMVETGRSGPKAAIVGFGADGKAMEIEISATIGTVARDEFLDVQQDLLLALLRLVQQSGLSLGEDAAHTIKLREAGR